MSTTTVAPPRKPNRRGVAAREKLLVTALELLGTGRAEAVSINFVAKEAGLSWGSVQNLFGDSDGFWSAVVDRIIDDAPALWIAPESDTVSGRVAEMAEMYRRVLDTPYSIAVETVRAGLPRPIGVLTRSHPKTAASLMALESLWAKAFVHFFDGLEGLEIDEQRAMDVAYALPISLLGLRVDQSYGADVDADRIYSTIVTALTAYLEG